MSCEPSSPNDNPTKQKEGQDDDSNENELLDWDDEEFELEDIELLDAKTVASGNTVDEADAPEDKGLDWEDEDFRLGDPSLTAKTTKNATAAKAPNTPADDGKVGDPASVAIIVPFRDIHADQKRDLHLKQFLPHMIGFLTRLQKDGMISDFHIYIMEQSSDGRKFNRGKLLNIGFAMAQKSKHTVFIFHDVDLLPTKDLGPWYAKFPTTPIHIARVWDRYSNSAKYFGGVVSFSSSDYQRINGFPNTFWGWGGEDDEMQKRCEELGIQWTAPDKGPLVDLEEMNLDQKLSLLRKNRYWKNMVKWELLDEHAKTWKTNGLADLKYTVLKQTSLDEYATKITVDVTLQGRPQEKAAADGGVYLTKQFGRLNTPASRKKRRCAACTRPLGENMSAHKSVPLCDRCSASGK